MLCERGEEKSIECESKVWLGQTDVAEVHVPAKETQLDCLTFWNLGPIETSARDFIPVKVFICEVIIDWAQPTLIQEKSKNFLNSFLLTCDDPRVIKDSAVIQEPRISITMVIESRVDSVCNELQVWRKTASACTQLVDICIILYRVAAGMNYLDLREKLGYGNLKTSNIIMMEINDDKSDDQSDDQSDGQSRRIRKKWLEKLQDNIKSMKPVVITGPKVDHNEIVSNEVVTVTDFNL